MDADFEQRLQESNREDLIELVRVLILRHPLLRAEIEAFLDIPSSPPPYLLEVEEGYDAEVGDTGDSEDSENSGETEGDVEETDDWDFGGDENDLFKPLSPLPLDVEMYRQRIEGYTKRLEQGEQPRAIITDLAKVSQEAELRAEQQDYYGALDIYALVLDERLQERSPALLSILDEAIDAATPALETLLGEASSNTIFDENTITLSPLLTAPARQRWLERLFTLWLKRVDAHSIDDELPEIMLSVAWQEDVPLLRSLAQNELQKLPRSSHSNIVDFTRQFRYRALEKFLRELPRT